MSITSTGTPPLAGKNRAALSVMVVDDDPLQVEVIAVLLGKLGVSHIIKAVGAVEALRALEKRNATVDLMLTDLHMPGMDGFEFMESAVKLGFSGALIIVSGQTEEVVHSASLVARLRRIKLLGSVMTPVTKEALSRLIQGWRSMSDLSRYRDCQILVVDDDPMTCAMVELRLQTHGMKVTGAQDGCEAVDLVKATQYDLILMDLQMPTLDGVQATRQIRQLPNGRDVPILATTPSPSNQQRVNCLEAGMTGFLAKPFIGSKLMEAVSGWINLS